MIHTTLAQLTLNIQPTMVMPTSIPHCILVMPISGIQNIIKVLILGCPLMLRKSGSVHQLMIVG